MTEENPLDSRGVYTYTDEFDKIIPKGKEFKCERCNETTISDCGMANHMTQVTIDDDTGEIKTWCRPCWRYIHPKAELEEANHRMKVVMEEMTELQDKMSKLQIRIQNEDELCGCEKND